MLFMSTEKTRAFLNEKRETGTALIKTSRTANSFLTDLALHVTNGIITVVSPSLTPLCLWRSFGCRQSQIFVGSFRMFSLSDYFESLKVGKYYYNLRVFFFE
ncbi:hypothetical protein TNIN_53871 [Trichonephila inaurata madagascariensis]|uniref:Uncharacterized protein n=1 Tax=Trichonephila inaurata madagascariensis TaxID=2747483 RepID=A0A8X6WWM2_9ARAC|nr:hypothetical protein TNIN_53871 [Trichonephila inaurata madagascariensis]